ncbi:MAG: ABC transporter ATP-binding protein [Deltaproteobacteria bacterium]|nr:ABC transporter ATP-binding protein [Deltaproteobacteria bacterium]
MTSVIELKNINKNYMTGEDITEKVLKNISFSVKRGEFLSIMGPSGSGKSTCMNIIGCLDSATSGSYYLSGKDVFKMTSNELAYIRNKTIGFVFQGFNLLAKRNLIDNVSMPLVYRGVKKKERQEIATEFLSKVNLKGYEKYLPTQLSGGMKQRVAIARAIASSPEIILADEPTGNLDSKTSFEILKLFQELNSTMGITIIMITHEAEIAETTNRTIYIKDGKIEYDKKLS